jgi:hypothetical protein
VNATVFWTVFSGVITYVLGQLVMKLVVDPVHELRKTIGLISHALIERGNIIMNPGVPSEEVMRSASEELRQLSSQLQSHLYLVPCYKVTARIFRLPSKDEILVASSALIGLSNRTPRDRSSRCRSRHRHWR